jgi:hypothetical protein
MRLALAALLLAAPPAAPHAADAPSAEVLLRDSDRARGGLEEGITWSVELEAREDGSVTRRSFLVKARGDDALAESTAPPRNKGEIILFNDRTMWFVKPGLRKPVSISARQRLSGEAANGDITSTRYARDYEGAIVGDEEVGGEPAWKLELRARATSATYDRIRYWISKRRHLGVKAEFLTVSGEVFKTATFEYENRARLRGETFDVVSRMTIRDAMGAGNVTVLTFGPPRAERHPPAIFNVNDVAR